MERNRSSDDKQLFAREEDRIPGLLNFVVLEISETVLDVVIADVSGHGATASLLMPSLAVALLMRP